MGFKETRIIQAFKEDQFPALEAAIIAAAGFCVPISIAWDTLIEEQFSHLYKDTYPKIYFYPLVESFKIICADDFGKRRLKNGLKKVLIVNECDGSNLDSAISFEAGVLKINHSPVVNAANIAEKVKRICFLLQTHLETFSNMSDKAVKKKETLLKSDAFKKMTLSQLHNQSLVLTFERQDIFSEIIEGLAWSCNMMEGLVTYGEHVFDMQIIGTYSEMEQSWLWGWANTQSGIPEHLLETSLAMKALGEKHGIQDLLSPKLVLDHDPGHYFSVVASGLIPSSCYVPLLYNGLVVYVLITAQILEVKALIIPALICAHFSRTITRIAFDHKEGLFCYLSQKGYEVVLSGDHLLAKKETDHISGVFDSKGRLLEISNASKQVPEIV